MPGTWCRCGCCCPMVALISFMVTPYQTLMPIFAAEIFTGGAPRWVS